MPRWEKFEISKEELLDALNKNMWLRKTTADYLGVGRGRLSNKMQEYGLKFPPRKKGRSFRDYLNKYIDHPKYKVAKNTYNHMIKRCYNTKNKDYKYYGGRGVKVCDSWKNSFENFMRDCLRLKNCFEKGFSIDRIDNNGHYCYENVRFVPHVVQCNNTRSNRRITYNGETKTLAQWARHYNIGQDFLKDRLMLGFTFEEAVTIPKGVKRKTYYKRLRNDEN